ncbi:17291_t:CDS:2 [Funneliformis geosporum]|uniref:8262_t:CDS:1 n=1 Tax=Funneliformis geosporum TaxID=1117311 RepID=A0A9W4STS1_9GLOM|nr:17291_t:CDS:2 [Funneliformis geosporum]CAI2181266.1 8262_t:CDS:2 [Funneliformis geosporum]
MFKVISFLTLVAVSLAFVSVPNETILSKPRWGHSAVLLNDKLYIYGGKVGTSSKDDPMDTSQNSNQLLILDVSVPFSIKDPAWKLRLVGPRVAYHTISLGGLQNELLVLYGGEYSDVPIPANPLFYYNTSEESPLWIYAGIQDKQPAVNIREHTVVTRFNDSMNYFFGGINTPDPKISAKFQLRDLFKVDTRGNHWNIMNVDINTPPGRFHHTATILSDGKMYIIGGYSVDKLADMNQIYVYDTIVEKWSVQTAVGTLPSARRDHTAVGTHDGKVIIHGGVNQDYTRMFDDIAILDTTKQPYTWKVVKANGVIPTARYSHTATIIGTNMLIAFGYLADNTADNNIHVLDTNTYTWKQSYTPENLEFTKTTLPISMPLISIVTTHGVDGAKFLFILLIGVGLFWFYNRQRRRRILIL